MLRRFERISFKPFEFHSASAPGRQGARRSCWAIAAAAKARCLCLFRQRRQGASAFRRPDADPIAGAGICHSMTVALPASCAAVRSFPANTCSNIATLPAPCIPSAQPTSMAICGKSPVRTSLPRIFGLGPERSGPPSPTADHRPRRQKGRCTVLWERLPHCWVTQPLSAVTSILPSFRPSRTERCH